MRWIYIVLVVCLISCDDETIYAPKPKMYPKIEFPVRSYETFNEHYCDFIFDKPRYSRVDQEKKYFDEDTKHPCWFDLKILPFDAEINFSYYPISTANTYENLVSDAFELASKHNSKADFIDESVISNVYGTGGLLFKLEGPVASPIQFYMTDTTKHFLRGALYFNSKVNADSIAPILQFVEEDIKKITHTLRWIDHE